LVKPEVDIKCQGQKIDLSMLFTEGRTRILMGCKTCNKKTAANQDFFDETEKVTNQNYKRRLMAKN
jgi:hypothetical protein